MADVYRKDLAKAELHRKEPFDGGGIQEKLIIGLRIEERSF